MIYITLKHCFLEPKFLFLPSVYNEDLFLLSSYIVIDYDFE